MKVLNIRWNCSFLLNAIFFEQTEILKPLHNILEKQDHSL